MEPFFGFTICLSRSEITLVWRDYEKDSICSIPPTMVAESEKAIAANESKLLKVPMIVSMVTLAFRYLLPAKARYIEDEVSTSRMVVLGPVMAETYQGRMRGS